MKLSLHLKPKVGNEYYVFVSLSHQSKRVLISTPYIIGEEYVSKGKIINRTKYAEIYNNEILKYEERLSKVVAPHLLSLKDLKDIITSTRADNTEVVEFFSGAEAHIAKIEANDVRRRTASIYSYNLGSFRRYINREKLYTFEMTRKMMQEYIQAMVAEGKEPKTIANKIAILKSLFYAIRDEYNDYDLGILVVKNDPFRKLQIPQSLSNAGEKALLVEDLRKVINTQLQPGKGYRLYLLERARDYFLLSFYLLGINPIDMWNLKNEQMSDGRIVYSRRKTQRRIGGSQISIPVSDKALELIQKHRGRNGYLLDMRDSYERVETVVNSVSRYLGIIYPMLGLTIDKEHFTWYSARHTWASIAANECHFSDAEVARALNHQSEHKVTRGYIRPDWSLLDRMNDAVLSVVFK